MMFWDWKMYVEEFEKKHSARVTFAGRSSGWIILLDQYGFGPYNKYDMWELTNQCSAKEVVALAQTLWEFHRLVAELAEDFLHFAEEEAIRRAEGDQAQKDLDDELDSTDTSI
jgi:hypothetical protein